MSRKLTAIASATPHGAHRLAIPLGARVPEVVKDFFFRVAALDVSEQQHRLAFEVGEAGHQGMVVGVAPVAMNLGKAGEEPLDEIPEAGAIGMACDEHPLPGCERLVEIAPHRHKPPLQRLDLAIARVGGRQLIQRLNLLEDRRDRFFEVECFRRHYRSSTDPVPTSCSTSEISAGEGRTRI